MLRGAIRQWMDQQGILEVLTPALSRAAATDPHVPSVKTSDGWYLQTSPEFPMKRLLAAHREESENTGRSGQPDIYQIAAVFRAGESGRFHNTQFTLLEWYRVGFDHHALMQDVSSLLQFIWQSFSRDWPGIETRRYGVEVFNRLGQWPDELSVSTIESYFKTHQRSFAAGIAGDGDAALDLFMDEFVLPDFNPQAFTLLIDYPSSQAALARLGSDADGRVVAERFELYFGHVELANGFHELSDATVQRERFESNLAQRKKSASELVPIDEHLLQALAAGFPDCAGVALGLERLQMVLNRHTHIREVLAFDDQRA